MDLSELLCLRVKIICYFISIMYIICTSYMDEASAFSISPHCKENPGRKFQSV